MSIAPSKVHPMDLQRTAGAIAANHGDKGAIVISVSDDGIRVGTEGLTAAELRHALCVAISCSFELEAEAEAKA